MKKNTIILFALFLSFFFIKINAQQLDWIKIKTVNGTSMNKGVTTDLQGNIYIVGGFHVYYGNGGGGYVEKYSPLGTLLWSDTSPASLGGGCTDVEVDASGNIYVSIYTSGNMTIGGIVYTSGYGMFLVKYSPAGQVLWVVQQGSASEPKAMAKDSAGFIYVTGERAGGGFITKYDSLGTCVMNLTIGNGYDIALDATGNIFVCHSNVVRKYTTLGAILWTYSFADANKIATDPVGNCYVAHSGWGTVGLTKLNPVGQVLWTINPLDGSVGHAVSTNSTGDVYSVGHYDTGVQVGMGISKFDCNGNQQWYYLAPNPADHSSAYQVARIISTDSTVYVCGYRSKSDADGFLLKLTEPLTTSVSTPTLSSSELSVFPNPSGKLFSVSYKSVAPENSNLSLKIYDLSGKCIMQKSYNNFNGELNDQLDLGFCTPGVYTLEIISNKRKAQKKIVLQ